MFLVAHCAHCKQPVWKAYRLSQTRKSLPIYCSAECIESVRLVRTRERRATYFWTKVDMRGPTDCWPWKGYRDPNGYGRYGNIPAQRVAFELAKGSIPEGMSICHSCDNPPCVNPHHLWLGTQADNVTDMITKGRKAAIPPRHGEEINTAKLTSEQAIEIFQSQELPRALAARFGITTTAVYLIQKGKNWAHVTRGLWT